MSERRTLTVAEAARELGCSLALAYQACADGTIPAVRLGARRWVIPRDRFERELLGGEVAERTDRAEPGKRNGVGSPPTPFQDPKEVEHAEFDKHRT